MKELKDKIIPYVILVILVASFCSGIGWLIYSGACNNRRNYLIDETKYNRAMIYQADHTLVIGNLEWYDHFNGGRMYKLKMDNGKTYLVPYTNITLIDTGN